MSRGYFRNDDLIDRLADAVADRPTTETLNSLQGLAAVLIADCPDPMVRVDLFCAAVRLSVRALLEQREEATD